MFIPKIDRISSEYWVQRVPLLLFLSFSPLFTRSPHSLQRELILLACSVNEWSAEKPLSMMEKGCTHTPAKSLYHSLQDWITKMNNWLQKRRDWTNKHTNTHAIKNPGFATAYNWNCHKMLQDLLPTSNKKEGPVSTGARCHAGMSGVNWGQAECNGGEPVN